MTGFRVRQLSTTIGRRLCECVVNGTGAGSGGSLVVSMLVILLLLGGMMNTH